MDCWEVIGVCFPSSQSGGGYPLAALEWKLEKGKPLEHGLPIFFLMSHGKVRMVCAGLSP